MSAWMFSHRQIDKVVTAIEYGAKHGHPTPMTHLMRNGIGAALLEMNAAAIVDRYADRSGSKADNIGGRYQFQPVKLSEMQLCKTLHCYLYQCSEGDVPERKLFKELEALRQWFDARLGYQESSFSDPTIRPVFVDPVKLAAWHDAEWG